MFTTATFAFALSLSADAFAVSLAKGAQFPHLPVRRSLLIAAGFAVLEALTPLVGWLIGSGLGPWLVEVDHWLAFAILAVLGIRMIWQAAGTTGDAGPATMVAPSLAALAAAAFGSSVDGFAVGMTFALMTERIVPMLLAVVAVTFAMAWVGLRLGHVAGSRLGAVVQALGGLGLIAIGTKILLEHLVIG